MTTETYSIDWKTDAHAINGQEGSHYDLAAWVEGKGFEVLGDSDDMQHSFIARRGTEDYGDRVIGSIHGDAEARVTITANLD